MAYDSASAGIILPFKHGDRTDFTPTLAQWCKRAVDQLPVKPDLICPVPLHPFRLFQRRYNQSALLSGHLAKELGVVHVPNLIKRIKNTASQGGKNGKERRQNVRSAFKINPRHLERLNDSNVLIVDDVYTTGATLSACAYSLRKHAPSQICAITIARVVPKT
jgi:ComF family protein